MFHPSIVCNCLTFSGLQGGWNQSQLILGEQQGTVWISCQLITGLTYGDKQPFTPTDSLTFFICLWIMGRTLMTQREPTQTQGEHREAPGGAVPRSSHAPRTFLLWGNSANRCAVLPTQWFHVGKKVTEQNNLVPVIWGDVFGNIHPWF